MSELSIKWPDLFSKLGSVLGALSFSFKTIPYVSCVLGDTDYYQSFIVWTLVPPAVVAILVLLNEFAHHLVPTSELSLLKNSVRFKP